MFTRVALPLLALALTAATVSAQLTMTGPATVEPGEEVRISIKGLPEPDLSKPLGESFAWLADVAVDVDGPHGCECEVEMAIGMTIAPLAWRLNLTFTPDESGVYVVVFVFFGDQQTRSIQTYRVEVGPVVPPTPPPPPPPPPVTATMAVIVIESADQNQEQAILAGRLRDNLELSRKILILDPDTKNEDGTPDSTVSAVLAAKGALTLPVIAGYSTGEQGLTVTVVEALPETAEAAVELLKSWGIE